MYPYTKHIPKIEFDTKKKFVLCFGYGYNTQKKCVMNMGIPIHKTQNVIFCVFFSMDIGYNTCVLCMGNHLTSNTEFYVCECMVITRKSS